MTMMVDWQQGGIDVKFQHSVLQFVCIWQREVLFSGAWNCRTIGFSNYVKRAN